jgi:hypothetical protein
MCTTTCRRSANAGHSDAEASWKAAECSASARAAARIIVSVTRRAPEATTASPMAGKMYTLLLWAIGIVRPELTRPVHEIVEQLPYPVL